MTEPYDLAAARAELEQAVAGYRRIFPEPCALAPNLRLATIFAAALEPSRDPGQLAADDVREALVKIIHEAVYSRVAFHHLSSEEQGDTYRRADAILAAFEVRPRGTVTDDVRKDRNYLRGYVFGVQEVERRGYTPCTAEEHADTLIAEGFRRPRGAVTDAAHDRDGMMICRKCGAGLTALDVVDGEKPCPGPRGTVTEAAVDAAGQGQKTLEMLDDADGGKEEQ